LNTKNSFQNKIIDLNLKSSYANDQKDENDVKKDKWEIVI